MSVPRGRCLTLAEAGRLVEATAGGTAPARGPRFLARRVYERPWPEGLRVLVDRLWPRGLRRDEVDVWAKELAPSEALRRAYGHDPEKGAWFRERYEEELAARQDEVALLRRLALSEPVVLLYAARDDAPTNGRVLLAFLERR